MIFMEEKKYSPLTEAFEMQVQVFIIHICRRLQAISYLLTNGKKF